MKRFFAIMLCFVLVFSLCACTDSKDGNENGQESQISSNGTTTEKDGVLGVELPDLPVNKDKNNNSGNSSSSQNPDSSVSSDGSVSDAPQSSDGNMTEDGNSGSASGSEGSTEPYNPNGENGIELPEFEF